MRRRGAARLLALACALSWAASGVAPKRGQIIAVRVRGDQGTAIVEVQGDRPLSFTTLRLVSPPRLVLDFTDAELHGVPREQEIEDGTIRRIGAAAVGARTARVVIELTGEAEFDVRALGARLDVRVARVPSPVARAAPAAEPVAGEGSGRPLAAEAAEVRAAPPVAVAELSRPEPARPAGVAPSEPPTREPEPAREPAPASAPSDQAAGTPGAAAAPPRASVPVGGAAQERAPEPAALAPAPAAPAVAAGDRAEARQAAAGEAAADPAAAREAAARESAARELAARAVQPPEAPSAPAVDPRQSLPTVSLAGSTHSPRPPPPAVAPAQRLAPLLASRPAPEAEPAPPRPSAPGGSERAQAQAESGLAVASATATRAPAAPPAGGAPGRAGGHAPRPLRAALGAGGSQANITGIGFRPGGGGAVVVRSDRSLDYGVSGDDRAVLLHLRGAGIRRPNDRRPLDTRFFGGVVERVVPLVVAGGIDLRIELRAHADYQLQQGDGVLSVTFSMPQ